MTIFQAIVYGIVQGITEFLPVSSTAHLELIPWLVGWASPGNVFDVALHLGTASAVIIFFFKDWISLIKNGFTAPKSKDGRLFWWIVIATIPGALAGVLLDKYVGNFSPLIIGILLILMGIVLYVFDKIGSKSISLEKIGVKRSILVGIAQVFAIVPGISRSGITMSIGRISGINRESIAKFTFLLSTPIILGDALYKAKDLPGVNIDILPFIVAILTAAIVGILSIKFLLGFLKTKSFFVFAVYRFIIGAAVIIIFLVR
ncbi:MAG: undecaprenyl-diphosphate phosphatase [Oscillospiraceae bacterium]|nr:undecaprenyl-diphosphate phosphatase [Oscillospiraceae bacterium]